MIIPSSGIHAPFEYEWLLKKKNLIIGQLLLINLENQFVILYKCGPTGLLFFVVAIFIIIDLNLMEHTKMNYSYIIISLHEDRK